MSKLWINLCSCPLYLSKTTWSLNNLNETYLDNIAFLHLMTSSSPWCCVLCACATSEGEPPRSNCRISLVLFVIQQKCRQTTRRTRIRSLHDRLRLWTNRQHCRTRPWFCLNSSITPWTCLSLHLEVTEAKIANWANGLTDLGEVLSIYLNAYCC